MTVCLHECKLGRTALLIWTAAISFMLLVCLLMFPEMKGQVDTVTDMFANMGGFSAAFGMDRVNFGEAMGFYAVECGNILGIGGGFFAALLGVGALAKEEKDRTAEFLLTHPVSRASVVFQKLLAVLGQIAVMNLVIVGVSILSFTMVGETVMWKDFLLLHLAYLLLQIEIACVCFGLSAFLKRGSLGVGIGLAAVFYFMNIIANISDKADFLRYVSPFAYADAADIVAGHALDLPLVFLGLGYAAAGAGIAFIKYCKKDVAS